MTKKILIISSDQKALVPVTVTLQKDGHHVTSVSDVFTCLDTLVELTPDVIFLDLIMPQIQGDEVLRVMKQMNPEQPPDSILPDLLMPQIQGDDLCRIIRQMDHLQGCYIVILSVAPAERNFDYGEIGANGCIAWAPVIEMLPHFVQAVERSTTQEKVLPAIEVMGGSTLQSRKITKDLLEQNHHLKVILEGMSQGILELSADRIIYANPKAIEIIGRKKEELLGTRFDDIPNFCEIVPLVTTLKGYTLSIGGRRIVLEHFVIPNTLHNRIIILSDITEMKKMESVIQATNLVDNLGYVFSGLRHEIGNPVNSIKVALTVLQRNLEEYDTATVADFIDRSLMEVTRIEYLLKALKNYSLFEKPNLQSFSITTFIEDFMALIRTDFEHRNIRFQTFLPKTPFNVYADSRALHHIMLNILTNAADAVESVERPKIVIGVNKVEDQVRIKVDDNGVGINEEAKKNLFKPFFTSKQHGTGLGLVIVKKMLDSMDCKIHLESYANIGTTVILGIPLSANSGDE